MTRSRHRYLWFAVGVVLVTIFAYTFFRPFAADLLRLAKKIPPQPPFAIGDRTLIVAPHPDDETLGGAGVIQRALAAGKRVKVVIMTNGDGFRRAAEENFMTIEPGPDDFRRLGQARRLESLNALKHFGVPEANVVFLGYPDGGVNSLWESDWDYDHLHKGLNGSVRSPYDFSYEKNAPYCGENVLKNLSEIFREFQPTDVVYPDPNDQHHDHWATSAFVKYLLTEQNYQVREWTYLVHRGDFPVPWRYEPSLPLHPPHVLAGLDTHWIYIPVTEQEETKKKAAIDKYATQTKVMGPYLHAFVRANELLGTYKDPVLPTVSGTPDFSDPNRLPYTLFFDAYADTFRRQVERQADIMAVGGVLTNEKFHIGLETGGPISPQVMYNVRIRIFQPTGVKRLDLTVQNSKVSARKYAGNSLDLPSGTIVQVQGNRLWISLPRDSIDGTTSLLVAADTFIEVERIDKTAWRLIKLTK
ncbi:PIG-L deacetylase family protein [Effusibacillus consociatus]|uniref:PIG-L deacetylase family protein n=1 Tax=Effusibacillus consociatus TaxID=1117041 RepID=A0ABV9Q0I1_9BACL